MKIEYVWHSIANNYGSYIEINRHLKDYPELLKPILQHELDHKEGGWTWSDFKLDFISDSGMNIFQLFKFMIKHPASFLQLSPIVYSKKRGFSFDINLLVMYLTMIFVFSLTIYLGLKYL